jgi:hypothetical protein
MNENENLVTEQVAENVEQTTEETPKLYTEDELNAKVNEITGKRLARREAKIRKEVESEYKDLVETLEAGTGKKGAKELNDTFKEFYEKKGITINKKSEAEYSKKDIEVLAKAEADEIIDAGYEEVVEEVDRLTELGFDNMTAKDKAVFKKLAEYRQSAERGKELAKIGVTEDVYNSDEFKDFASMFNSNTPIAKIYETYAKTQPKKEFKTTGSMKSTNSADSDVKDYYTPEEARRFTRKELDNNPTLFKAIENSMRKWRKK